MRFRHLGALVLLALLPNGAWAARDDDEGVLVRITVVDTEERPIPNAWVRVPDTEGRRIVDPETGIWESRYLYAYDGMEIFFERRMTLEFTISAPGHATRVARYRVRGGKNQLTVVLPDLTTDTAEVDTDVIWFRRSGEPRRGSESRTDGPAPAPRPSPVPPSDSEAQGGR